MKIYFPICSNNCTFSSFAQHWEMILLRGISNIKHTSPFFTVWEEHLYLFCQIVQDISKSKEEMEQLRKSFLEDFSSHEGLFANWFELYTYANLQATTNVCQIIFEVLYLGFRRVTNA
jgi:hypothetical protein